MREAMRWISGPFIGAVLFVALIVGIGSLASCGETSWTGGGGFKDLEGISPQDPTDVRLYNNADGYPNIVILCTDGVAWATTTRDAQAAIQRVPELDPTCTGYEPR